MSELEDRINQILGDPDQMQKISSIAQSLMGGEGTAGSQSNMLGGLGELAKSMGVSAEGDSEPLLDTAMLAKISSLMRTGTGTNPQERALLEAMKPYLSEKRRKKMDKALKIAKLAKVAQLAMGEMGEKGGL